MDVKKNQAPPIHDPFATTIAAALDEPRERDVPHRFGRQEARTESTAPTATVAAPTPTVAAPTPTVAAPTPSIAAPPIAVLAGTLKLVVKGLKPMERQLLEGIIRVSQRRSPRLALLGDDDAAMADVVMIDTLDPKAMDWAQRQSWLKRIPVIWLDATNVPPGHTLAKRPVNWPILPMLLARALEQPSTSDLAAANQANAAPSLATPAAPVTTDSAHAVDKRRPILVVDDSLAVRAYLRSLLEARGFAVSDAASVRAGLEIMTERTFDCVLMDVLMPDLDGYEGCRQIKARQRGASSVPVVMLTSKSSPFDRIRGKMAGCDAYLTKPVEPKQLTDVLQQHVHRTVARPAAPDSARIPTLTSPVKLNQPTRAA